MLVMMEVTLKHNAVVGICYSLAVSFMFFKVAIVIYGVFHDLCHNLREKCFVSVGPILNRCG